MLVGCLRGRRGGQKGKVVMALLVGDLEKVILVGWMWWRRW